MTTFCYICYSFSGDEEDNDDSQTDPETPTSRPLVNFAHDVEHPDDFGEGWFWHEVDPGASTSPFTGQPGLLFDPGEARPQDFFNELFDKELLDQLVLETNLYSDKRDLGKYTMKMTTK